MCPTCMCIATRPHPQWCYDIPPSSEIVHMYIVPALALPSTLYCNDKGYVNVSLKESATHQWKWFFTRIKFPRGFFSPNPCLRHLSLCSRFTSLNYFPYPQNSVDGAHHFHFSSRLSLLLPFLSLAYADWSFCFFSFSIYFSVPSSTLVVRPSVSSSSLLPIDSRSFPSGTNTLDHSTLLLSLSFYTRIWFVSFFLNISFASWFVVFSHYHALSLITRAPNFHEAKVHLHFPVAYTNSTAARLLLYCENSLTMQPINFKWVQSPWISIALFVLFIATDSQWAKPTSCRDLSMDTARFDNDTSLTSIQYVKNELAKDSRDEKESIGAAVRGV